MQIRFWGVRGSIASPGPGTVQYGGNTPCVELQVEDQLIIIDSGTGIRELGNSLIRKSPESAITASLFIGHTHWDHIQGFPFFMPLYLPSSKISVYGVHGTTRSFFDVMSGQMGSAYFPVQIRDLPSKPNFIEMRDPIQIGPVKVTFHYLNHPGITIGFRFEYQDKVLCYISDHEPYGKLNRSGEFSEKEDAAVARFVSNADLLICEAQYTATEYLSRRGWGHSTFDDVLDLASKASTKQLALFHHDPSHDDEAMKQLENQCIQIVNQRGASQKVFAAREGMTIKL